ncbi:DUF6338 family protein [Rhodoblastus acidophilus]|uniref:DUF6338 family protein n=1 Tax=Rhodoblastus acidophilus TaxID=1074 RepID=UPI003CC84412
MHTVHPLSAAWDWRFHNTPEHWVLVKLKNDTTWAGYLGKDSFISSDPLQRDLYIQQVFEIGDDNAWTQKNSGVLINAGEISTIEFWPILQQAECLDERQERENGDGRLPSSQPAAKESISA